MNSQRSRAQIEQDYDEVVAIIKGIVSEPYKVQMFLTSKNVMESGEPILNLLYEGKVEEVKSRLKEFETVQDIL